MTDWFRDNFMKGFASAVEDVRRTVLETGWFGKPVTGKTATITIGSLGGKSPSEKLGWTVSEGEQSPNRNHDRDISAKEPKGPDRGIDL